MSDIAEAPGSGLLTSAALLSDFLEASWMAAEIRDFKSWIFKHTRIVSIQNDPLVAPLQVTTGDVTKLLESEEEQADLVRFMDLTKQLDLRRFIGVRATVVALEDETIKQCNLDDGIDIAHPKQISAPISSFHPVAEVIRFGEGRYEGKWWNPRNLIGRNYWEVKPFATNTDEFNRDALKLAAEIEIEN